MKSIAGLVLCTLFLIGFGLVLVYSVKKKNQDKQKVNVLENALNFCNQERQQTNNCFTDDVPAPMKKEVYVTDAIDNLQLKFKFRSSNKSKKQELQGN